MSDESGYCAECDGPIVRQRPTKLKSADQGRYCGPCWRHKRRPPNCGKCGRFVPWKNMGVEHYQEYSNVYWECDHCGEVNWQD